MSENTENIPDNSWFERHLLKFLIAFLVLLFLYALLPSPFDHPPEVWRKISAKHQLKDIGNAVFDEYDSVQTFPPGLSMSEEGEILHGLPTLLLPYLGEKVLFESIDLDKPYWDEANQQVMQVDVEAFLNPMVDSRDMPVGMMHYAFNGFIRLMRI